MFKYIAGTLNLSLKLRKFNLKPAALQPVCFEVIRDHGKLKVPFAVWQT